MIAPGTLLVITVQQDVTINSTCGINIRTLTGIHLVTFHNCTVYIKNELYENYELRFYQPTILPLQLIKIKTLQVDRHINISELQEFNIQNRKHLETVDLWHRLGIGSLSTVIIFMLAFFSYGIFKYRQIINPGHCSGRAKLAGVVVNNGPTPGPASNTTTAPRVCTETAESAPPRPSNRGSDVIKLDSETCAPTLSTSSPLGARSAVLGNRLGYECNRTSSIKALSFSPRS